LRKVSKLHLAIWKSFYPNTFNLTNETTHIHSGKELTLYRTFDAPVNLVWEAWTKAEYLATWWGPSGFTITTHEMSFVVGGVWRFMMHGPDGTDFPNKIKYTTIEKPKLLAYDHMDDVETESTAFSVKITFEADGQKTNLTMRSAFSTAEALEYVVKNFGAIEGGKQTLARLAQFLNSENK
jgi:uncharacterized protein YndB with AHSA1/START domain